MDGCNYIIGSRHLIMARNATAAYADIEAKKNYNLRNIRSGCSNSLPAADGLFERPQLRDRLRLQLSRFRPPTPMVHMPEVAAWDGTTPLTLPAAAGQSVIHQNHKGHKAHQEGICWSEVVDPGIMDRLESRSWTLFRETSAFASPSSEEGIGISPATFSLRSNNSSCPTGVAWIA